MKKWSVYLIGLSLTLFTSTTLLSQEWSDSQKEVWETVNTYVNMFDKGDVQGLLSYFDESFSGWSYSLEAPHDKNSIKKMMNYWSTNNKVIYSILTPAKIWVEGDYAFVHYYHTELSEDKEGKKTWKKSRWTDILLKKDGKWMIVGDHGGAISK